MDKRKPFSIFLVLFTAIGTLGVFAQNSKKFSPNATIVSRQKNSEKVDTKTQRLSVNISSDDTEATFTFDSGRDRMEIAADQYGRWGFSYYNNGRLAATGVYSSEPASVNEVYWYFNFSNITNRNLAGFKSGDVWTWKVRL
ncbi:MAG: hypothetical protein LBJ41_01230 [Treponema sp.]|nr:hypothetical protein [Treponema sp.]